MIHDWEIFGVVLAIGIGQTVLIVYAGYLSTLSLHPSKRPGHYLKLSISGAALMLSVICLGVLVDRTQFAAKNDAEQARSELAQGHDQLAASRSTIQDVHESIARLQLEAARAPKSTSPGAENARNLDLKLAEVQQKLVNALGTDPAYTQAASAPLAAPIPSPATITPAPQPATSTYSPPAAQDTKTAARLETGSRKPLRGDLRNVTNQVKKLDVERQSTLIKIGEEFSSTYRNGNIPYQLPPGIQTRIAEEDSQDTTRYVDLIPAITRARRDALATLQLTPQQAAEDSTRFEEANKLASSPSPVSKGSLGMYVNTKRFGPISAYLQGLDQLASK